MSFIIYIIYSATLDRYYVGYTAGSMKNRLKKHNSRHKGFTGKNADWMVKYIEVFTTKDDAMKREKQIKSWKSRIKIEQLISIE